MQKKYELKCCVYLTVSARNFEEAKQEMFNAIDILDDLPIVDMIVEDGLITESED